jgi:hypothetical protein
MWGQEEMGRENKRKEKKQRRRLSVFSPCPPWRIGFLFFPGFLEQKQTLSPQLLQRGERVT